MTPRPAPRPPRYLRTPGAARFRGLAGRTLKKPRSYGPGPAYRKLGGRVWRSGRAAPVQTFTFSQSGFSGGGSITGSFTGSDTDGNGPPSSLQGETSAFSPSFAGGPPVEWVTPDEATPDLAAGLEWPSHQLSRPPCLRDGRVL